MGVISSTCKLTLSVLLFLCCVQTILGNKFTEVNRWDRNETTEIALGITEGHLISEQNIHIPKLFILGSQKCASTSLYDLFENQHSNICNRFHKETGYFDNIKSTWAGGIKQYESLLRHNETCQRFLNNSIKYQRTHNMDATPRYFDKKEVALRMYHSYSRELRAQLRFILVLREPVAREFSWYNHNVRFCTKSMHKYIQHHKTLARKVAAGEAQWDTSALCHERHCKSSCRTHAYRAVLGKEEEALATFAESYRANETEIYIGTYSVHLKHWLNYFDRSQFFIVNWETLLANTTDTVERMTSFLGLPPFPQEAYINGTIVLPHDGAAGVNTTLDCTTRSILNKYYEPYNQELYELLESTRRPDSLEPVFPKFRPSLCSE